MSYWKHRSLGWWAQRFTYAISAAIVGGYGWSVGLCFPLTIWASDCHFTTCDSPIYIRNQSLVAVCMLIGACFGVFLGAFYGLNRDRLATTSWQRVAMRLSMCLAITTISPCIVDTIGGSDLAYHCTNLEDRICDAFHLVGWSTTLLIALLGISIVQRVHLRRVTVQAG